MVAQSSSNEMYVSILNVAFLKGKFREVLWWYGIEMPALLPQIFTRLLTRFVAEVTSLLRSKSLRQMTVKTGKVGIPTIGEFCRFREGQLPEMLSMISLNYLTPLPSLLFIGGGWGYCFSRDCRICLWELFASAASIVMLFAGDVLTLINYCAFSESLVVAVSVAGLVKMRLSQPNAKAPIKVSPGVEPSEKTSKSMDFSWTSSYLWRFCSSVPCFWCCPSYRNQSSSL